MCEGDTALNGPGDVLAQGRQRAGTSPTRLGDRTRFAASVDGAALKAASCMSPGNRPDATSPFLVHEKLPVQVLVVARRLHGVDQLLRPDQLRVVVVCVVRLRHDASGGEQRVPEAGVPRRAV